MKRKNRSYRDKRYRFAQRLGRGFLFAVLLVTASCARIPRDLIVKEENVRICSGDSLAQAKLQEALELIQKGNSADAREIMDAMMQNPESSWGEAGSVLYLGVLELLEKGTLAGMEARKKYFEDCSRDFPAGPCRVNAETIVRLLEKRIAQVRREAKRKREMSRTIEKQAEEIQTLKYQIQKLEEIQQEADRQRESLELK